MQCLTLINMGLFHDSSLWMRQDFIDSRGTRLPWRHNVEPEGSVGRTWRWNLKVVLVEPEGSIGRTWRWNLKVGLVRQMHHLCDGRSGPEGAWEVSMSTCVCACAKLWRGPLGEAPGFCLHTNEEENVNASSPALLSILSLLTELFAQCVAPSLSCWRSRCLHWPLGDLNKWTERETVREGERDS